MKPLFTGLFFLVSTLSFAQRTIDVNKEDIKGANTDIFYVVGGQPFVNAKFTRVVEGSPYFRDGWMKGMVFVDTFKRYSGILLKLDLLDDEVHFQDDKGVEMVATGKIDEIVLYDSIDHSAFTFVRPSVINLPESGKGWYQLLTEDSTAMLFKRCVKEIDEIKPYGSATVEQHIRTSFRYYILYHQKLIPIKKMKDLPDILIDKKQEIAKYLTENTPTGKTDNDFINVMNFYKTLHR